PLGPAPGVGRAPGGAPRGPGPGADDPPRHDLARGLRAGGAARARAAADAPAGSHARPRRAPLKVSTLSALTDTFERRALEPRIDSEAGARGPSEDAPTRRGCDRGSEVKGRRALHLAVHEA